MSAESQIGRAIIFGLDGTMAYSGMATAGNEPQSMNYEDTVESHKSKDKKGEVIGEQFFNPVKKTTIDFFPCDVAGANKILTARANVVLPAYGATVTLAGFPPVVGTAEATLNSTKWIYEGGGKIDLSNEDQIKMTLPLARYNTDISTPTT